MYAQDQDAKRILDDLSKENKSYTDITIDFSHNFSNNNQQINEAELIENTRKSIAGYKLPKTILFTDEVQRAPNGKANYKWAKTFAEEQLT